MKHLSMGILILMQIYNCGEKTVEPTVKHTITGKVTSNSIPIAKANVSLNNNGTLSTQSDSNGNFLISNIPAGDYIIYVEKFNSDGSFISKVTPIIIKTDTILQSLTLPNVVKMCQPENPTSNSLTLKWNPTVAHDFREYKLYRHTTSGLDETTGLLVNVITEKNDTIFIDTKLDPLNKYFYRIFVMNDFGKLAGSNIVSASTTNENLIINGNFEELSTNRVPAGWIINSDIFCVDSNKAKEGKLAIRGIATKYLYELNDGSLRQTIPYTKIQAGMGYRFSFWYYVVDFGGNSALQVKLGDLNFKRITSPNSSEWQFYSFDFTGPLNLSQDILLDIMVNVNIPYNGEPWKIMLDDFQLIKK